MLFSYNWLQSFFSAAGGKAKLPKPEELARLLTMKSFEVKDVKKQDSDFVFDIDVLPNRSSDCLSHIELARECSLLANYKFKTPLIKLKEDKILKTKDFIAVDVKEKEICSRYTARVISDIKVDSSPRWLQERLISCGLRPINNVVDVTNYVMLETGQPLHAFDRDKIGGRKIIVRFAKKGEKITTLDKEAIDMDQKILVIADVFDALAIAGIKGGVKAEIDPKTKTVVLESANFDRLTIYKTSKKIGLQTEASLRFGSGLDPNLASESIDRAAALMQEICGGKITEGIIDIYPKKIYPQAIVLDLKYLRSLLGLNIVRVKAEKILHGLGFKVKRIRKEVLNVSVPTRRLDVSMPEDLIEEVGRVVGFDSIPPVFPVSSLVPSKRNEEIFWDNLAKNLLKEIGFTEICSYSFVGEREADILNYSKGDLIEIENPQSLEQRYLRPSLIPNLLNAVRKNASQLNEIEIFELGKIFERMPDVKERKQLTGLTMGRDNGFFRLKGAIDALFGKLGIAKVWYDDYNPTPEMSKFSIWRHNFCAEIKVDNIELGFLGEISPKILQQFKIPARLAIFDIDFRKLSSISSEEHEYRPVSKFPEAIRDLAALVPLEIRVEEVLNKIEAAGGVLVRDVDLFDIYEGENLPEGKKNLAFHIIYQAEDRTLSSGEIAQVHQKIIKALEEDPEWEVRK